MLRIFKCLEEKYYIETHTKKYVLYMYKNLWPHLLLSWSKLLVTPKSECPNPMTSLHAGTNLVSWKHLAHHFYYSFHTDSEKGVNHLTIWVQLT